MGDEGRVVSVSVSVAYERLQGGNCKYLDVRTEEEFSDGHPCGSINVPYLKRGGCMGMSKNKDFVDQVSSQFGKSDEILVGCQSGGRSLKATADLMEAGFTAVTDIAGGYSAWTMNGLPTTQD